MALPVSLAASTCVCPLSASHLNQAALLNGGSDRCQARERERFALLIAILLRYLDKVAKDTNDLTLKKHARRIIHECIQLNREGRSAYTPLVNAIGHRLRQLVGPIHWSRAKLCLLRLSSRRSQGIHQTTVYKDPQRQKRCDSELRDF